jgi:AcrR family transcriptional regulator
LIGPTPVNDDRPGTATMYQREPDETSEALLESARQLLVSEGATALTVRRIANEVGLSTMNVYSRFGGKDGIIDVLYREGFVELFGRLAAVPRTRDLRVNVKSFTSAYRQFALDHRHQYDLMFRSSAPEFTPSAESSEVGLGLLDGLIARVELAQSEGIMKASIPSRQVAVWVWATCHGMLSLEFDGVGAEVVDWSEAWDAAIDNMASILLAETSELPEVSS